MHQRSWNTIKLLKILPLSVVNKIQEVKFTLKMWMISLTEVSLVMERSGNQETQDHLFNSSMISIKVWKHFAQMLGIREGTGNIRQRALSWWLTKEKNPVQSMMLQIIPSIIIWKIWKERCKSRYENLNMSLIQNYQQYLPSNCYGGA